MKKNIIPIIASCILIGGVFLGTACVSADSVTVTIDGQAFNANVIVEDGVTLVPMRDIFEALGMNVNWEGLNQTIYATKGKKQLTMTVGETAYTKNGDEETLSVAPKIVDGKTYVPLRAVGDALGADVDWNSETKRITITTDTKESDDSWKNNTASINLDDETGDSVEITEAGDYTISGSYKGMIVVNSDGKVKLRLNGVDITNENGPAIYVKNADKCYITLEEGTENTLTDGSEYSSDNEDLKATIYSKDDLVIKGKGTLTVNGNYQHGIASKDEITIENGTININANVNDGIHANDGVKIEGGTVNITAENDGIQSEGYVEIAEGTVNITTKGEVDAPTGDEPMGGGGFGGGRGMGKGNKSDGQSGEQSDKSETQNGEQSDKPQMPNGEQPQMPTGEQGDRPEMPSGEQGQQPQRQDGEQPQMPSGEQGQQPEMPSGEQGQQPPEMQNGGMPGGMGEQTATSDDDDEDSISSKGIKADGNITILNGEININSTDTAIKGDMIAIEDGNITIKASIKKGIKAMGDLFINGGDIDVDTAYEGIETKHVMVVNGGNINVDADEDGINAGGNTGLGVGRSTDESNKNHSVVINGGTVTVNSTNDGIDSNGSLYINGGTVLVYGSEGGADSAFDTDGIFEINGGWALGAGSNGMLELPKEDSAQNVLNIGLDNAQKGSEIKAVDEDGKELFSITAPKSIQSIIFSSPDVTSNKSFTVTAGDTTVGTATAESRITTIGNANTRSFGGGGNGGGRGNRKNSDSETGNTETGNTENGDKPSGDFGGNGQMPGGDFGGNGQMPNGDFGGNGQKPNGDFGGNGQRPNGDFGGNNEKSTETTTGITK